MKFKVFTAIAFSVAILSTPISWAADAIQWQPYSVKAFAQARQEHKLVLLDLEAVWCHWCHVMNQDTYTNETVIQEINQHFIPVRMDQDARPDLANRFRDYGWPATIVFNDAGEPLIKEAGYIEAPQFLQILKKIVAHPQVTDSETVTSSSDNPKSAVLSANLQKSLYQDYLDTYDAKQGSWGVGAQKFMDADSVEYAIARSLTGDARATRMAQQTLTAEMNLIDPVWGGVYQYSTGGNWKSPHTEKIMSVQASALNVYSLAVARWHRPQDARAVQLIAQYLQTFLTAPSGAFYTSQDADVIPGKHDAHYYKLTDALRRKIGIPKVDQHIYARENGWAIAALVSDYEATGNTKVLATAEKAARWIADNRKLDSGLYSHDEPNKTSDSPTEEALGPYLGDSLAMGQAYLSLYTATADRDWLKKSMETADTIEQNFKPSAQKAGYLTAKSSETPYVDRTENIQLARWTNLLSQITGKFAYRSMAEQAMRFVSRQSVAEDGFSGSPLLAAMELKQAPLHITIRGGKKDPAALLLFKEALRYPTSYKRVEWWDTAEGPLPNPDVTYPSLPQAAAFICTNKRCSLPIFKPADLRPRIDILNQPAHSSSKGKI